MDVSPGGGDLQQQATLPASASTRRRVGVVAMDAAQRIVSCSCSCRARPAVGGDLQALLGTPRPSSLPALASKQARSGWIGSELATSPNLTPLSVRVRTGGERPRRVLSSFPRPGRGPSFSPLVGSTERLAPTSSWEPVCQAASVGS
jgi:hypothetical protein